MTSRLSVAVALLVCCFTALGSVRRSEVLSLALASGAHVQARLLRPAQVLSKPLPVVVVLGGLQRGAKAIDLLPPVADAILVGLDYPAEVPKKPAWHELLPLARELEAGIATMIEALGVLHGRLQQRTDVDARRLTIVGASLGSPFAVIAADRFGYDGVVLAHGFADLPRTIGHQFARRWEPRWGSLGSALAWLSQQAIVCIVDLPDVESHAQRLRAQQRVYVLTAAEDEFIPRSSSQALIDALRRSAAAITVEERPGGHMRGTRRQLLQDLFERSTAWMRREGLL